MSDLMLFFAVTHFAKQLMQLLMTADVINLKAENVQWNIARALLQNSEVYTFSW